MIFGIGTDIVEVSRIEASLSQFGFAFAARILTADELVGFETSHTKARFLAKRFAAKEAILKSMGIDMQDGFSPTEIEILQADNCRPLMKMKISKPWFGKVEYIFSLEYLTFA